ncbi:hypothetical protein STAS_23446 [Striga asiatica]|uniref:Uncharacterized protein n=1 Tax=Striga asiatica TaxID=4170 RepID=A0A5A7QML8_STRAF|nr:hypothetical protein STAS_23446 [Striga asiatica]
MKNNLVTNGTKLILLHPYIQKQGSPTTRFWLLALFSLATLISLATLLYTTRDHHSSNIPPISVNPSSSSSSLPPAVSRALLHYATSPNTSSTDRMPHTDARQVADAIRQCPSSPCSLLVFGLTHETLLWRALNHAGRTVFVDENRYYAAHVEERYPDVEAYDVQYATRLADAAELVRSAREAARNECRPVQNLLFSECRLGLNDLPNQMYEVDWDVILVDGPRGYWPDAPGRMAAIFTAGVLARSKRAGGNPRTHVFVHDYNMEADRVASDEFLCRENLVRSAKGSTMAHFVIERMDSGSTQFCRGGAQKSAGPAN